MNYKSYIFENNIRNLKNNIALFYGENLGLKSDFKNKIKNINLGSDFINLNQEEIFKDFNLFYENFFNISLFGENKIYFINEVNDKILEIIKELENKIDNQKIYLYSENLDKKSKLRNYFEKSKKLAIIPCYVDSDITLKRIINETLKDFKGLTTENINTIINSTNLNRVKLINELIKIKTFFSNKIIENSKLVELLNLNENENFEDLRDAALCGSENKTNQLLNETVIDSEKAFFYLNNVNYRLTRIKEAISNSENSLEENINTMKPPIFWKDKTKFLTQAKKWNIIKIQNILGKTFDLELKIKSNGNFSKNILIKKLMVDICILANT